MDKNTGCIWLENFANMGRASTGEISGSDPVEHKLVDVMGYT